MFIIARPHTLRLSAAYASFALSLSPNRFCCQYRSFTKGAEVLEPDLGNVCSPPWLELGRVIYYREEGEDRRKSSYTNRRTQLLPSSLEPSLSGYYIHSFGQSNFTRSLPHPLPPGYRIVDDVHATKELSMSSMLTGFVVPSLYPSFPRSSRACSIRTHFLVGWFFTTRFVCPTTVFS